MLVLTTVLGMGYVRMEHVFVTQSTRGSSVTCLSVLTTAQEVASVTLLHKFVCAQ